jgi:hypothetical protein
VKLETLVKSTCEDWSAEARVPAGLADRALRGRTRRRSLKVMLAAGSTALLLGAGAVIVAVSGSARQPSPTPIAPVTLSADTTLRTDLGNSFPRHLVAAGHTAVAAYHTSHRRPTADDPKAFATTWYLYDPATGTYEQTPWAFLDVAPGMHQAAVLEGPLPATRVGILDMNTRKVTRWIPVGHPVAGASWAPDGRRLILTAYDRSPDTPAEPGACSRTGYYVVNAGSGHGRFHPLAPDRNNPGTRQDLGWSRNGTLIWAPTATDPEKVFYDLDGKPHAAPPYEAGYAEPAGLSPNGTLRPRFGPIPGPAVTLTNVTTGKVAAILPIEQAWAWADDEHLFAVGCAAKRCKGKGEFHNRLLLVDLKGKITPLTGYHRSDQLGSWVPVFTHR